MRRTFLLIMLVAVLLLASTGVVLAQQSAAPPDASSAVEPPTIVNGQPADPGEYPAQGFLLIETSPGNFSACGGTLVDTVHFLTAAHCVTDDAGNEFAAASFQITLGEVDRTAAGPEDRYGVNGVDTHENWDPDTFANDVAMLTLDERADFTPTRVVEANETNLWLPNPDQSILARIIGWGRTMAGGTASNVLLEADAPMRTDQVMTDAYGAEFDPQLMVGAGDGTTDTCQGDSGGPLLVPDTATAAPDDFALAGLTSFGRGCADPNFPGIYTRIGSEPLNGWVHERINEPPVAQGDAYSTDEDQPLTQPAPGVLANDTDVNGDTLEAVRVGGPSHGTLTLNSNGSFTYTPNANFNGTDTFTYRADDGSADSNVATVTITVNAVNDPPTAKVAGGGQCGTSGTTGTINLTVGDVESSAGTLTLSTSSDNQGLVPDSSISSGGSGAGRTLTVNAQPKRSGTARITLTVSDRERTSSITITVIVGTDGRDTLSGTEGTDMIFGKNGNDVINADSGNDLLCGGNGAGTMSGGSGDDTIDGARANDVLRGEAGKDILRGSAGDDTLTGGTEADSFSGGPGTDTATDLSAIEGDTQDGTIP